ncbi:MAG: hypothetical protein ACYCUY_02880 [Acidithiobacillus sp.]
MNAAPKELFLEFIHEIESRGITLTLAPDGHIEIGQASRLSQAEIKRLKELRPVLEAYLKTAPVQQVVHDGEDHVTRADLVMITHLRRHLQEGVSFPTLSTTISMQRQMDGLLAKVGGGDVAAGRAIWGQWNEAQPWATRRRH